MTCEVCATLMTLPSHCNFALADHRLAYFPQYGYIRSWVGCEGRKKGTAGAKRRFELLTMYRMSTVREQVTLGWPANPGLDSLQLCRSSILIVFSLEE